MRKVFLATDNVEVIAAARASAEFDFLVRETESARFYSGEGAKEFVERRLAKGEGDPAMIGARVPRPEVDAASCSLREGRGARVAVRACVRARGVRGAGARVLVRWR